MVVIQQVLAPVFLVLCVGLTLLFSRHCRRRYDHSLLSLFQLGRLAIAAGLMLGGWAFRTTSGKEDLALILLTLAGLIFCWSLGANVLKTSLLAGLIGTGLQLLLIVAFFATGMFVPLIIGGFLALCAYIMRPLFFVNRGVKARGPSH